MLGSASFSSRCYKKLLFLASHRQVANLSSPPSCGRAAVTREQCCWVKNPGWAEPQWSKSASHYFRLTQCYVSTEIQNERGLWELSVRFVYPAISRTWELCFRNKLTTWHTQFENRMPFGTVQLKATGSLPDFKMNTLWQIFPLPFLVCASFITLRVWSCSSVGKPVIASRSFGWMRRLSV